MEEREIKIKLLSRPVNRMKRIEIRSFLRVFLRVLSTAGYRHLLKRYGVMRSGYEFIKLFYTGFSGHKREDRDRTASISEKNDHDIKRVQQNIIRNYPRVQLTLLSVPSGVSPGFGGKSSFGTHARSGHAANIPVKREDHEGSTETERTPGGTPLTLPASNRLLQLIQRTEMIEIRKRSGETDYRLSGRLLSKTIGNSASTELHLPLSHNRIDRLLAGIQNQQGSQEVENPVSPSTESDQQLPKEIRVRELIRDLGNTGSDLRIHPGNMRSRSEALRDSKRDSEKTNSSPVNQPHAIVRIQTKAIQMDPLSVNGTDAIRSLQTGIKRGVNRLGLLHPYLHREGEDGLHFRDSTNIMMNSIHNRIQPINSRLIKNLDEDDGDAPLLHEKRRSESPESEIPLLHRAIKTVPEKPSGASEAKNSGADVSTEVRTTHAHTDLPHIKNAYDTEEMVSAIKRTIVRMPERELEPLTDIIIKSMEKKFRKQKYRRGVI